MDQAVFIAKIFGPFMVLMCLWTLVKRQACVAIWRLLVENASLIFFFAILNLLTGLVILSLYNSWESGLVVLVTLLGWLLVIRGGLMLFYPKFVEQLRIDIRLNIYSAVGLVYGICLCILAFGG